MEARTIGPRMGLVALCAAIIFSSSSTSVAQYGAPVMAGPQGFQTPGFQAPGIQPAGVLPPGYPAPAYSQNGYSSIPPAPGGMMQSGRQGMPARGAMPASAFSGNAMRSMDAVSSDVIPSLPPDGNFGGQPLGQGAVQAGVAPGQSENFIVLCRDPKLTAEVSRAAEQYRRDLAMHWLGYELPPWSRRCPIQVTAGPRLGAGGETRFVLHNGNVGDWQMSMQGTPERILDSVLPHEITHTILASHFALLNKHVPRWADEGACTTVEHDSEQKKHKELLIQFMRTGKAMSFNRMFSLTDYPREILTLYAQGHSVSEFLIAQGGPQAFVKFLEQGMQSGQWEPAVRDHYGYETLGKLQREWNDWIADGRGSVEKFVGRPSNTGGNIALVSGDSRTNAAAFTGVDLNPASEGQSVELGNFANAKGQASMAEVSLVAGNAGMPNASSPSAGNSTDGFYRQRLESNLRDKQRVHNAPVLR